MPSADVVVVGAGLAGLSAAIALAEAGATVQVLAAGHAATHWASGGLDVAALPGSPTARAGVLQLAAIGTHPYALVGDALEESLAWLRATLEREGLRYDGELDAPLRTVPSAIGGTRRVAILPAGQAAALAPWTAGQALVVCGPAGFKDFWPDAIAASLRRPAVWGDATPPSMVRAITVELPGLAGLRNLDALELARRFDEPGWRAQALDAIARALDTDGAGRGLGAAAGRVALPAVLGLDDHVAVLEAARARLPLEAFEVPLVPPSIPGMRLYRVLRAALRRHGGRIQVGEPVLRVELQGGRVSAVVSSAAVRELRIRTDALVLATGGIAGGGLLATADGRLEEPLLGLPVEAPAVSEWLAADPFDPAGHPLEAAGIRVDRELRPVASPGGPPILDNVRIVGSLLAGQRYLRERCGDGVALSSGWLAARSLRGMVAPPPAGTGEDMS